MGLEKQMDPITAHMQCKWRGGKEGGGGTKQASMGGY